MFTDFTTDINRRKSAFLYCNRWWSFFGFWWQSFLVILSFLSDFLVTLCLWCAIALTESPNGYSRTCVIIENSVSKNCSWLSSRVNHPAKLNLTISMVGRFFGFFDSIFFINSINSNWNETKFGKSWLVKDSIYQNKNSDKCFNSRTWCKLASNSLGNGVVRSFSISWNRSTSVLNGVINSYKMIPNEYMSTLWSYLHVSISGALYHSVPTPSECETDWYLLWCFLRSCSVITPKSATFIRPSRPKNMFSG